MSRLRLALCQMNATVGDLAGNAERIRAGIDAGREAGAQVVLFPELALSGYPPEDLLLRAHFLEDTEAKLHELAGATEGIVAIVGFPERSDGSVLQLGSGARSWCCARDLPQGAPAQLRRVRRAALLQGRQQPGHDDRTRPTAREA